MYNVVPCVSLLEENPNFAPNGGSWRKSTLPRNKKQKKKLVSNHYTIDRTEKKREQETMIIVNEGNVVLWINFYGIMFPPPSSSSPSVKIEQFVVMAVQLVLDIRYKQLIIIGKINMVHMDPVDFQLSNANGTFEW